MSFGMICSLVGVYSVIFSVTWLYTIMRSMTKTCSFFCVIGKYAISEKKLSKLIAFNVKYTRLFNSGKIYGEHVQWQLEILYSESKWKEHLFFIRFVVSQAVNIKMWDFETRKKENLTSGYIYNGDMTEKAVAVETIILIAYVNRIK